MVKVSYHQKPYRRMLMETWGAKVTPSPSDQNRIGPEDPDPGPQFPGQPGDCHQRGGGGCREEGRFPYSLGSVLNHVILHQTVVGLETRAQLKKIGSTPTF